MAANSMKCLIIRAGAERSFASTTTGTQTGNCFLALHQHWQMRVPSVMHGFRDGESFPPASDLFPIVGNMVVGGDGEVRLRPGASALPVGWRVGAGATALGCGLFIFAPRWMASVAGAWGRGVGLRPFLLPTHPDTRRGFYFLMPVGGNANAPQDVRRVLPAR